MQTAASIPAAVPAQSLSRPEQLGLKQALEPSRETMWQQTPPEPAFAAFHDWTDRYARASTADEKSALEKEGQALASVRLTAIADLIQTNPERALELAAPYGVRHQMPGSVRALLEEPINTVGDYDVIGFTPLPDHAGETQPVIRLASVHGETLQAFTFGKGLEYVSRSRIPLNGLAVPASAASAPPVTAFGSASKLFVLDPNPVQTLDAAQIEAVKTVQAAEPVCDVSKQSAALRNEETAVQLGGEVHFFCGVDHAVSWSREKSAGLGLTAPVSKALAGDVEYSSYTEGRKRILLCRVDFPDFLGEVMTTNQALTTFQTFSNNMAELSYNKLLFAPLGQGSYITPTMHLTNITTSVQDLGLLLAACHGGCTALGIDWNLFDFHFVCTSSKPAASFAGVGYVGGDGFWLANSYWGAGTATHEYGHNLGLNHANYWDTSGNSIIGAGTSVEYGDNFDPMGAAGPSPQHYNSRYKNYLNWISNTDCPTLTANGTYRVYAHDVAGSATAGVRGLRVVRNASQNYWVDFRQRFSGKPFQNGVGLHWTGNGNQSSLVLDSTPASASGLNDSPLTIGRTFSDVGLGLHITPIGKGNTYPESMDVVVNFGNPSANLAPYMIVSASSVAPSANQSVTFSASATDPNGDALAYFWDFGDGDFSTDNKPTTTHSFAGTGDYFVQCTVSDMKGGVARDSVIIRVGSPTTFRISGRVLLPSQQPLGGVRVSVDSSHYAFTDSDGTYAITRLAAGSYTVKAVLDGYLISAPFFNNPIAVGPSFTTADFVALPGSQQIYTPMVSRGSTWKYLDNGSDQGTAWTSSLFNDSTWLSGPAVLGYGQGNEATTIGYGPDANNKYITYYFRSAFTVVNPGAFTNAFLEVLRDDGVVVYLNGTEVFRDNMPAGALNYKTLATAAVEPSAYLSTNLPASLLIAGNNTLTAEIHQADPTSSDINFDLALSGLSISNASFLQIAYVSSPDNDQVFPNSSDVPIAATIRNGGSPVSLVEFYGDNLKIGEDIDSPYTFAWTSPSLGNHTLKFIATLQNGMQLTSAPVRITIEATIPPITILPLVDTGSVWLFYASNAAPTGAWANLGYNDALWPSGPAQLGYGEGDEATTVPFGGNANNKWVTVYFRKTFTLEDPAAVTNLMLNLKRDDGAVVYLNGVEVLRDYMPPGAVTWGTLATNVPDDGQIFTGFNLDPSALAQGTNVLAVEIHQSAITSSDLSFDAGLLAAASAVRSRHLQLTTPADGSIIRLPDDVTLSADALAGLGLTISKVEFFDGAEKIGEDTSYPFAFTWGDAAAGTHQLTAVGTDSGGGSLTSAPVNITVISPPVGTQLISFGDVWKYMDDGSNQGTNWSKRIFDDRAWMAGPSQLGYGGDGEITTLSYGTNINARYITAYFRKAFVVSNPSTFSGLLLRLIRDDGAVVYLNGVEVLRNNLQPGQVSWNSLAPLTINPPDESTPVETNLSSSLLLVGTNVVAVEMHQSSITSSDASFDLALIGLTSTNTAQGVYVTSPGNNAQYNSPARVGLTAFAQSANGSVSLVEYFDDAAKLGQATTPPYSLTWNNGALGTHLVTARATYGGGLLMTSPPVSIVIGAPPPPIAPVFQTLVRAGSDWKYWDNATAAAIGWQNGNFDDAAWPGGFARFGWGLDGEVTQLTSNRVTHYFRRWFNVANPSQLTELAFQLVRDDGAIVYLNGVEVFRSNMPAGPVNASTLAASTVNTPEETTYFESILATAGSGLLQGSNLVAVELHQGGANSSDAGFDLQILGSGTTESRIYLANPLPGKIYPSPGNVPLDAHASAAPGDSVSKVEFYADTNKIGEVISAPYSLLWESPAFGNYKMTAQALTAAGTRMTSGPVNISVSFQLYSSQIISSNSIWKFMDDGSNQGTAWSQLSFNDTGWRAGPARLGYGGDGEVTTVSYGPNATSKYITTYFRQSFMAPSNTVVTNLLFRLIRDDGAVVYLNGRELYRSDIAA
ncbi:MAG: hypothetical protein JWM16_5294, partial [Verrucomicrobiales bacterium]|nr:hypothetical protein [Verrucomicrobiales bacterium]